MLVPSSFALLTLSAVRTATAALTESSLAKHVDTLTLDYNFNPIKAAYWTGLPHHRRTPFALSPDGTTAYIAYLDGSETDVHIQAIDPSTFAATGTTVTVSGAKEAGGLVAHNDGFALLTNEALPSGTEDAPADNTPVPVLYRYTDGEQTWKTFLGGPGVHESDGLSASPDLNGDLAYSSEAGLYGAYFVITDYSGDASGHYGDSIQYVNENGTLQTISGASSSWGCSHNTGIAFEAADAAPFASICAEDQGAIWLNTETQGMTNNGVKISNENTTNGASGEPMGGMSGSYSALARFTDSSRYIFSWVSRGAIDLEENTWMGDGYTTARNRTNGRNVAIAVFSDKETLDGTQASSTVGAADGDSQVNWITDGTADCSNAHAAVFDDSNALVTWEEIADPQCDFIAMGCQGEFTGSYFQLVDSSGTKQGDPITSTDTYVAGDMITFSDGSICWPYVSMTWDLSSSMVTGSNVTKISFACMSLDGSSSNSTTVTSSAATTAASTTAVAVSSAASSVVEQDTSVAATTAAAVETTATAIETTAAAVETTAAVAETSAAAVETTSVAVVASSAAASIADAASTPAATATVKATTLQTVVKPSTAAAAGASSADSVATPSFALSADAGSYTPGSGAGAAFTPGAFPAGAFTPGAFAPGAWPTGAFTPGAFTPGAWTPGAFTPGAFPTPFAENGWRDHAQKFNNEEQGGVWNAEYEWA